MTNIAISVEHLSKQYDLGVIGTGTLSRDLNRWWARVRHQPDPYTRIGQKDAFALAGESILALDDVSFSVSQGEALGIIGKNGAGKSTLLKILSRVTAPTSGVVKVKGRIGSLLEIGTGFHPELTGRENVYLNGAILGMRKEEVARKFDEIVAFSGVEKFIDTPVKRYSSGMHVRLGFAVAAHLDPEILIVDEVLAVGDAEFQKKCLGKMGDVAGEGRTVLFVSHNMAAVQNLCTRAILIENGIITRSGETEEVITNYISELKPSNQFYSNPSERKGDKKIRIEDLRLVPDRPRTGQPLQCILEVLADESIKNSIVAEYSISFMTDRGQKIFQLHSGHMEKEFVIGPGRSRIIAEIDSLLLAPGQYYINLWIGSGKVTIHDWIPEAYTLQVEPGSLHNSILIDNRNYPVVLPSKWYLS
ncbi:MAG: ABC transporter ATP-binding protein [Anaerolineaceae bacterium]|nr:ABC transporter ATP-binding protein [Anaerolineaceae bacterium]MDD4042921.1 ABC transporter ATP-binding protein [Anaerolineaceae bacterium]